MRRSAVILALMTLGTNCTERLLLPGAVADGGSDVMIQDRPGGDSNGKGGNLASGGGTGQGGRAGTGTGGTTGRPFCDNRTQLGFFIGRRADLLLSVGRDAPMATSFGNGTRMSIVQQTLRALVMANQYAVNFAYQDFPSPEACSDGSACCANSSPVYPNVATFTAIDQAMNRCYSGAAPMRGCVSPSDSRPIANALHDAINPPQGFPPIFGPGDLTDRYLVLLVDGAPGCSSENSTQACQTALAQISQLRKAPNFINTYVVPIGDDAQGSDCVRSMALQSSAPGTTSNPFIYPGGDTGQLTQSLNQIVAKAAAASCVITLLSVPPDTNRVELDIQNQKVPRDPNGPDGWSFISGSQGKIEVHGSWCQRLQNAQNQGDVEVWLECAQ
jgi:hypothetical protein